jgi:hypothetical protein
MEHEALASRHGLPLAVVISGCGSSYLPAQFTNPEPET